ncbi:spermatogenesis-associated protein 20 [Podospora australis]|uniref:Spermatogenesis-associated protein 20 n=1 Tax=Podospora australis TaxID=1536484 RepID=A0AAN7AF84_9PEZI|nr:spermatogenesis-associated protein 20 [Podospora australis]
MMSARLQEEQQQQQPAHSAAVHSSSSLRNRAGENNSPYVRLHAETPVAWQPISAETLALAASQNKPIFLHVGFLADHLCRLTTQDSFSNPTVAAFLNQNFIPVIVDRDERPDLDTIYQNYSEALTATGGWPLNLFLTPELHPIYGGTYWPGPGTEHSLAAERDSNISEEAPHDFLAIARKIQGVWEEQEQNCRKEAFENLHKLQNFAQEGASFEDDNDTRTGTAAAAQPTPPTELGDLDLDQLDEAVDGIAKMFDPENFGFGVRPKFPNPARLSFLLRLRHFPQEVSDIIGDKEVENVTDMAMNTLRKIRDGGLRDHIGAGFMRFSVTSDWSLPHFEKMVGENALLLNVFLDAWLSTSRGLQEKGWRGLSHTDEFADVVFEVADYLSGPIIRKGNGGFVTSEAADSYYRSGDGDKREGAFYLWTRREFDEVVGAGAGENTSSDLASGVAAAYWNVQEHGNIPQDEDIYDEFINQNVLSVNKTVQELSKQFGITVSQVERIIESAKKSLRAHREKSRVRPPVDEKIVVGINGMVISALARTQAATNVVSRPSPMKDYIGIAEEAAKFIRENLWLDGKNGYTGKVLHRFWHDGRASETLAFADDYAFLIEGLLDLHETTSDGQWLEWARQLQDTQTRLFYDSPSSKSESNPPSPRHAYSGGFYSNESQTLSDTILRLKSGMDKSQPSTNAVSASNLFRLGALLDENKYTLQAKETINAFEAEVLQHPWLFNSLLTGVVNHRLGVKKFPAKPDDEDALMNYYQLPRAEARAIIVLWENRDRDGDDTEMRERTTEGPNGKRKADEFDGVTDGLKGKLEDLKI